MQIYFLAHMDLVSLLEDMVKKEWDPCLSMDNLNVIETGNEGATLKSPII